MNPNITFTIDGVDTSITSLDILKNSLEITAILYNDLSPATNKASFSILRSSAIIPKLLATDSRKIQVVIKDGATPIFTGFLTDSYSWDISSRGKSDVKLSAEDVGIKLLKAIWVSEGGVSTIKNDIHLCNPANPENSLVHIVATLSGVTVDAFVPTITKTVDLSVEDSKGTTYWDVLTSALKDFGYVFYFTTLGRLSLYDFKRSSITSNGFLDSSSIISDGGVAVKIQKKLRQYNQVRISWVEREVLDNERVFEDITGATAVYSCYIPLAPNAYYPSEDYSFSEYSSLDSGKELIRVNTISSQIVADAGISHEYTNMGTRIKMRFHNSGNVTSYIKKLAFYGQAVVIKSNNITIAGDGGTESYSYEAKHIRTKEDASTLANALKEYYKHCNFTYRFSSEENFKVGDIVTINENAFTGLFADVLITKKVTSDSYHTYEGHGISGFNLIEATILDRSSPANSQSRPQQGYTVQIESNNGFIFKEGESTPITLTARVFANGVEITDSLPATRFSWRRNSFYDTSEDEAWNTAHSSGYKSVSIIANSVTGRASYHCDILSE